MSLKKGNNRYSQYAVEFENDRGQAVALKCLELKENGLKPDLIIAHPVSGYFLKEIWRESKLLSYFNSITTHNSDVDFDLNEEHHPNDGYDLFLKFKQEMHLLKSYIESDALICPTNFQSTAPNFLKRKIQVVHDGIDTLNQQVTHILN